MLDDARFRVLVQRYAASIDELRLEQGEPLLVLPNGEFFPDRFSGDAESVSRLVARMQGYAGLEALELETEIAGEPAQQVGHGCGSGACTPAGCAPEDGALALPRIERTERGYLVRVPAAEVRHSIVLTSRIATTLGAIALAERGGSGAFDTARAELAATALGFGVLLLEASYLYSKSCGGPNVQRATALATDELAVPFALFLAREGRPLRAALAELGTTQRALVKAAWLTVDESPALVELLRRNPARVARGDFALRDGGSWFARLFGRSRRSAATASEREAAALSALERGASVEELEALVAPVERNVASMQRARSDSDAELRALVDEALSERDAEQRL